MEFGGEEDISALTTGSVVADFYAEWCGPCKKLAPIFAQVAEQFSKTNVKFFKIDTDQHEMYSIKVLPTLLFLRDGEIVKRLEGYRPKTEIEEEILKIYGPIAE
jgi:thioredoxin